MIVVENWASGSLPPGYPFPQSTAEATSSHVLSLLSTFSLDVTSLTTQTYSKSYSLYNLTNMCPLFQRDARDIGVTGMLKNVNAVERCK